MREVSFAAKVIPLLLVIVTPAAAPAQGPSRPGARIDDGGVAPCVRLEGERRLPASLERPRDLRWAGEGRFSISDANVGVLEWAASVPSEADERVVAKGRSTEQIAIPWELARSDQYLAVGSAVYELGWRASGGPPRLGVDEKAAYEAVFDLDLLGSRLLILGARWDPPTKDGFVSDGALAWIGDLSRGHDALRAAFFSAQGKGAKNAANCILAGLGRVRFLGDGAYVIAPQFEDGVFLYSADGRLARTWKGAELGLDVGCEMSRQESEQLALDEPARWAWVNARRTVDEILPTPEGFALFVREVSSRGTSWTVERVSRDGSVSRCQLPLSSASPHAHLRADVRAGELALLVFSLDWKSQSAMDLPKLHLGRWP